jgi:hypothetical protein
MVLKNTVQDAYSRESNNACWTVFLRRDLYLGHAKCPGIWVSFCPVARVLRYPEQRIMMTKSRIQPRTKKALRVIAAVLGACVIAAGIYFWNGTPETVVSRFITAYQQHDGFTTRRLDAFYLQSYPPYEGPPLIAPPEPDLNDPFRMKLDFVFPPGVQFTVDGQGNETAKFLTGDLFVQVTRSATPKQAISLQANLWSLSWRSYRYALDQLLGVDLAKELIPNDCRDRNWLPRDRCTETTDLEIPADSVLGAYVTRKTVVDEKVLTEWLKHPPQPDRTAIQQVKDLIAQLRAAPNPTKAEALRTQALNILVNQLGTSVAYLSMTDQFRPDPETGKYLTSYRFYFKRFLHATWFKGMIWVPYPNKF